MNVILSLKLRMFSTLSPEVEIAPGGRVARGGEFRNVGAGGWMISSYRK